MTWLHPIPARWTVAVAVAATVGAGIWYAQNSAYQRGVLDERTRQTAAHTTAALHWQRRIRAIEHTHIQTVAQLERDHAQRANALQNSAAAAHAAASGLRRHIARLETQRESTNSRPLPTPAATAAHADALAPAPELLSTCAGRYTAVAARADALGAQLHGLQQWARAVSADTPSSPDESAK